MKHFAAWWFLGFVAFTALTGNGTFGALAGLATWWVAVQVWWRRPCLKCSGHPRFYDWGDATYFRPCPACEGRGWVPRMFAMGRE
jgi:hypothetical protein